MTSDVTLSLMSAAFLILASVAYVRQKRKVLSVIAVLFFVTCTASIMSNWWPISPILTIVILAFTLGLSAVALILFIVDLLWAPFALEMTYLTFLCWILCPLAVLIDFIGLAI